jgi:hypothetical protein
MPRPAQPRGRRARSVPSYLLAALGGEGSQCVDRLRRKSDVAHHGNAAFGEECDRLRHPHPAFELDRAATGFLQDPRRGMKCLLARSLVAAERHVHHDQRVLGAPHHRAALQDHHVQRYRHRSLETMHHIAQGIADQDDVAMAVNQRRCMRMVGGEHDDGLAVLAGTNIRRGLAPDAGLDRHSYAPKTGTPITTGWNTRPSAR